MTHTWLITRRTRREKHLAFQKRPLVEGLLAVLGRLLCMNTLTVDQQRRILSLLEEGHTIREVERMTGHRRETISLYGRLAGILPSKQGNQTPSALAA